MTLSRILLATLVFAPLAACVEDVEDTGPIAGGECSYEETHGTCTFVEATGGADVTFDFLSDDGTVTEDDSLSVGDGGAPPTQDCLDTLGIAPGVEVGCTLQRITDGTCTPVIFAFDDFSVNECLE